MLSAPIFAAANEAGVDPQLKTCCDIINRQVHPCPPMLTRYLSSLALEFNELHHACGGKPPRLYRMPMGSRPHATCVFFR